MLKILTPVFYNAKWTQILPLWYKTTIFWRDPPRWSTFWPPVFCSDRIFTMKISICSPPADRPAATHRSRAPVVQSLQNPKQNSNSRDTQPFCLNRMQKHSPAWTWSSTFMIRVIAWTPLTAAQRQCTHLLLATSPGSRWVRFPEALGYSNYSNAFQSTDQ